MWNGLCLKNIKDEYNIPKDAEGNSLLTGDGKDDGFDKGFTLAALETWEISY